MFIYGFGDMPYILNLARHQKIKTRDLGCASS